MRNADLEKLRNDYMESLPILKERFLNALISERMEAEDILERARRFNITLSEGNHVVAVVKHNLDQDNSITGGSESISH